MKKVIYKQFGSPEVLELVDVPMPEAKPHEVLVKVKAVSINPLDWKIFEGQMSMMTGKKFPKSIGIDFSGIVEHTTSRFKKGDEVFGMLDSFKGGALAEFIVVPEAAIALKPQNITFEQAATLPVVGLSALDILHTLGNVQKGDELLINGATGGIGIFLTQLAKKQGAIVTTVTGTSGLALVNQWKVDCSLDYTQHNVLQIHQQFDVVVDLSGKMKFKDAKSIMKNKAVFISTLPEPVSIIRSFFNNLFSSRKHKLLMLSLSEENLKSLSLLAQEGLDFVIDKTFPIEAIVSAYQHAKKGVVGKVVVVL